MNSTTLPKAFYSFGNKNQRGQTLAEYALILAFISIVAITVLITIGGQIGSAYTTIDRQISAAQNGGSSSSSSRTH